MSDIEGRLESIGAALESVADILALTADAHDRAKLEGIMIFCSREIVRRNDELSAIIVAMNKQQRAA